MGIVWLDTPIDVTPGSNNTWLDVDEASVPDGASGVIVHIVTAGFGDDIGLRKNGSSDNRTTYISKSHCWGAVGVDGSGIFEIYTEDHVTTTIWLVGYCNEEAVFFTNAPDISLGTIDSWLDIDISSLTSTNTAIGAIVEVSCTTTGSFGLRKNGSSDNRFDDIIRHGWGAVGVDGSEILEGQIESTAQDFFLIGYFVDEVTFYTNGLDRTPGSTGAWETLTSLPAGATGGIYEIVGGVDYGLQYNGSTEDILENARNHHWAIVKAVSQVVEGYIASASVSFFELGYFESAAAITVTINQVIEDNSVLNITENPISRLISQSLEEDISLSLSESPISRLISQVNESNVSNNINVAMILLLNEVNENNISLLITLNPISRLINSVNESDVPLNISENPLIRLINLVNESNESLNVNKIASKLISQVNENDISLNIIENPISRLINNVNENDISLSYGKISSKLINNVNENNIASSIILPTQIINVNNVNENNAALAIIENPISKLISQTFELDEVFFMSLIDESFHPYLLFKKRRRML